MLLALDNLIKTYAGHGAPVHAVQTVSLGVEASEFVAVCGPSGCGKSTLLLMAGGLLRPDSGEVRVLQKDPYQLDPDARAKFRAMHVGFVFQQFHLVPYLTVMENVLAPVLAVPSEQAQQRARELIERVGLIDRQRHLPQELSSGERQRVALARAMLNRPQLILADEPTGNLDQANAETVLRYLREFVDDGGGVLLVTHSPFAAQQADREVRLKAGRIDAATASV